MNLSRFCCIANAHLRHSLRYRQQSSAPQDLQEPTVLVEKDTDITLIGLNRENARNSIDAATSKLLSESFRAFEADTTSPVAVLYGVGGSFCAGYDLKELEQHLEQKNFNFLLKREGAVGPTRRHLRKPVICAINGFCVGSGLELALLCDVRVMENTAVLGFFNRHFGVPIINGGTARLPALIGYSRAMDLVLTGRKVAGEEALQMGLINRLVATGTSLGQAVNLAFSIAKYPGASLAHDRSAVYSSVYKETKGFRLSVSNEVMSMTKEIIAETKEGAERFKNSEKKGAKTDSWNVKEKPIPDWEREEIEIEARHLQSQRNSKAE